MELIEPPADAGDKIALYVFFVLKNLADSAFSVQQAQETTQNIHNYSIDS